MKLLVLLLWITSLMAVDFTMVEQSVEKQEWSRAMTMMRPDALSGKKEAQFNIGILMYASGEDVKALRWLDRAAQEGVKGANVGIAIILLSQNQSSENLHKIDKTIGHITDLMLAKELNAILGDFSAGTLAASGEAYLHIGKLYYDDPLVRKNEMLALELFKKGAQQGSTESAVLSGKIIMERGGENSYWKALEYFHQAALAGDEAGRYYEGWVYVYGPRGVRNLEKGKRLMAEAQHNNYSPDQEKKASFYRLPLLKY